MVGARCAVLLLWWVLRREASQDEGGWGGKEQGAHSFVGSLVHSLVRSLERSLLGVRQGLAHVIEEEAL